MGSKAVPTTGGQRSGHHDRRRAAPLHRHGQSVVAFAFCRLLGFELLPRLKDINRQKLYLAERGKAVKTISLCRYLHSEALRQEIHEEFNVVENWNNTNSESA